MLRIALLIVALFSFSTLAASNEAAAEEIVHYQLKEWKAKHIHDNKKATSIAGTLKKIGCEVESHQHNGHMDVKYRCLKKHEMKLKNHKEALQWEKWLKEFGFEASHTH